MARTRERSTEQELDASYVTNYNYANGSAGILGKFSTRYVASSLNEVFTDVVTPSYFKWARKGWILPVNVFDKTTIEDLYVPSPIRITLKPPYFGYYTGDYRCTSGEALTGYPPAFLKGTSADPDAVARLLEEVETNARAKMSSREMMIGATLFELDKTVSTIKSTISAAKSAARFTRKIVEKYKRRHYGSLANSSIDAAFNVWMEIRMGWRPFLHEVDTLSKQMVKYRFKEERKRFSASASQTISTEQETTYGGTLLSIVPLQGTRKATTTISASAGILARHRFNGYPDPMGASVNALPSTLWEITPLSWAVDYFCNVSKVISANVPDTLWEPAARWTTLTIQEEAVNEVWGVPKHYYSGSVGASYAKRATVHKIRYPTTRTYYPVRLDINLDHLKLLDTLAITKSILSAAVAAIQSCKR